MDYIMTYEGFELDKFKSFIKKHQKSGGYISKSDIKRLDSIGVNYNFFNTVKRKVDDSLNFLKSQDIDLLNDLMLDVYDEFPSINSSDKNIYYQVIAQPDRSLLFDEICVTVSEDDRGLPSRDHRRFSNPENITENIIERIIDGYESKIKDKRQTASMEKEKHGKIDSWTKYILRELEHSDPTTTDISIYPQINLELSIQDISYTLSYEVNNYYRTLDDFSKESLAQINRYIKAIGYQTACPETNSKSPYPQSSSFTLQIKVKNL